MCPIKDNAAFDTKIKIRYHVTEVYTHSYCMKGVHQDETVEMSAVRAVIMIFLFRSISMVNYMHRFPNMKPFLYFPKIATF